MPANVETMFSTRVVPWHGLGIVVEDSPTSEEALVAAGLNWDVIQEPIYVMGKQVDGYKANVRSTDKQVLGIVSDQYKIVQNREAFAFTDHLLGQGVRYETAGSLSNGRRVWLLAKLPETIVLEDQINSYLVFTNSHNGKGAVKVAITPVRVVCQNTLNLALDNTKRMWTTIHMGDIENKLEEAKRTLGLAIEYLNQFKETAKELVQKKFTDKMVDDFVNSLFPIPDDAGKKHIANIMKIREDLIYRYNYTPDLQNYKGTGWAMINTVSDLVTHSEPLRKTPTYRERLFERTIDGHPIIDKAYELLKAA